MHACTVILEQALYSVYLIMQHHVPAGVVNHMQPFVSTESLNRSRATTYSYYEYLCFHCAL